MTKVASWLLILCCLGSASAQTWPKKISPPAGAGKYSVTAGAGRFVYQTKSHQIVTFKKHGHTLMTNFTRCLESVPLAIKKLPVPLYAPPKENKGQVLLAPDEGSYLDAGGAKNTAGFYDGRSSRVIINWGQFRNDTVETRVIQDPAFDLVIHELTHLSMHELMWKCDPWLTEGIAEYMAAAHTGRGDFDFTRIEQAILKRVEKHTKFGANYSDVLSITDLVSLSSRAWLERTGNLEPWEALKAYNCALLLTHYCFHGGSERLESTRKHFEALHLVKSRRQQIPRLFSTKEATKIESAIAAYWRKRGLKITFEETN